MSEIIEIVRGYGPTGQKGWSPVLAAVIDGDRVVHQLVDWVGGTGDKPTVLGYVGENGIVPDIAQGVDINDGAYATAAQGALADTALQPASVADVALSGSYTDLSDTPDFSVYEEKSAKGAANGYAPLGSDSLIPSEFLPENGSYKGEWNASTNTPTITAGIGTNGDEYSVSVAGTQSISGSPVDYSVGDRVKFTTNGDVWQRIPNSQNVNSVNDKQGNVVLDKTDIGLENVDNTSDANKPVSTAQQTALNGKVALKASALNQDATPASGFFINGQLGYTVNTTGSTNFPTQFGISWSFGNATHSNRVFDLHKTTNNDFFLRGYIDSVTPNVWKKILFDTDLGSSVAPLTNGKVSNDYLPMKIVTPEEYGAVGNGSTNDSTAMLAWFAAVRAGAVGWMTPGKNYLITSANTLTSADETIIIYANGATLTQNSASRHFNIANTFENVVSVSSFSSLSYDFGGGATPVTRVNLSTGNLALFNVGDIVKVGGDAVIPTEESNQREGEFAQVGAKDSTGLILTKKIQFGVGANPIVGRLRTNVRIHIQDLNLNHIGYTATTSWSNNRLLIACAFQPRLINCTSLNSAAQAFQFSSCLMANTVNCAIYNARTYSDGGAFGYGIVEKHCEHSLHVNVKGYNCRHVFTTVAQGTTAGDGDLMNRGRNKYARIVGGNAAWCTNAAWDTHADSYGTEFHACIASYPYLHGADGYRANFQLRGINDRAVDCKSYGSSRGYHINRVSGQPSTAQSGYCSFVGCEHVGDVSDTSDQAAFQVSSSSGVVIPFALIENCRFQRNGSTAPFLRVDAANVSVVNPNVVGPNSTSGNFFDYLLNDGANVRIRGGYSNNKGSHASASYRPFRSDEAGTVWDVDDYEFEVDSGKFFTVISAADASGGKEVTASIKNIKTNVEPSSLTSVGTQLTNAVWVDINGGTKIAYDGNFVALSYNSTTDRTLSLSRRGGDRVFANVTIATTGPVSITAINDGAFAGQIVTVRNSDTSNQNLVIENTGNIDIGANITLTAGLSTNLYWSGSSWFRA